MQKVKMLKAGKWADIPGGPVHDLEEGNVVEFTDATAKAAIDALCAEEYRAEVSAEEAAAALASEKLAATPGKGKK